MHCNEDPMENGVDWVGSDPVTVPVTSWDPADLDTVEQQARELMAAGKSLHAIISAQLEHQHREIQAEGIRAVMVHIIDSPEPNIAARVIAFASGMHITHGLSLPRLARECGMTKQAFLQAVQRFNDALGNTLRRPNERTDEAKQKMSKRNSRNKKRA